LIFSFFRSTIRLIFFFCFFFTIRFDFFFLQFVLKNKFYFFLPSTYNFTENKILFFVQSLQLHFKNVLKLLVYNVAFTKNLRTFLGNKKNNPRKTQDKIQIFFLDFFLEFRSFPKKEIFIFS